MVGCTAAESEGGYGLVGGERFLLLRLVYRAEVPSP